MAGIVNQQLQPAQAPGAKPPQKTPVPPEATRMVIAAKKIIAQPNVAQQLVQMMKAAGDPASAIAKATIFLMKLIRSKITGQVPNAQAVVAAMQEVMVDLARLGATAKLFPFSPALVGQAMKIAVQQIMAMGKAQPAQGAPAQAAPAQLAQPTQPAQPAPAPAPAAQPAAGV